MHRTSPRFRKRLESLPEAVQKLSKKNFDLLKANPSHPSLHFKKVGKFWSVRIGATHKALAVEDAEDFVWVWIGTHDEYERMIRRGNLVGIIENVPAWVCNQCGERYYDGPVLEKIEVMLKEKSQPKKNLTVPAYEF